MRTFIFSILFFGAISSNAFQYNCKLTDPSYDSKPVEFIFDTTTTKSHYVALGDGSKVVCSIFRLQPQYIASLIGCGRLIGENLTNFVTTDEGVSIFALDINNNGSKSNLTCLKHQ